MKIIFFLFLFIISYGIPHEIFAQSPSFDHMAVFDHTPPFDYRSESWIDNRNDLDIDKISISSDGRILNATIWLREIPFSNSSSWISYRMLVNSDLNFQTGDAFGVDYSYNYEYVGDKNLLKPNEDIDMLSNWHLKLHELADIERYQVLEEETVSFSALSSKAISFSIDLKKLGNYPEKYSVAFAASDYSQDQEKYEIVDITRWILIPSIDPDFLIKPSAIEIFPGDKRVIEANLAMNSPFEHESDISIDVHNLNDYSDFFDLTLQQKHAFISKQSNMTVPIHIKINENVIAGSYTVPLTGNIKLQNDLITEYHNLPTLNIMRYTPDSLDAEIKTITTSFTVNVIPLPSSDNSDSFEIIYLIAAIVTIVGFVIRHMRKLKNKSTHTSSKIT